jgi:methanol metabolism-related c-type cytochrome
VKVRVSLGLAFAAFVCLSLPARADGSGDPAAVKEAGGEYYDKDGNPTYKVEPNGTVDWYSYSGYLRYNSVGLCIVCHGPDGSGSSFGPSLVDALKTLSYGQFLATVAEGKRNVSAATEYVMPAFGQNKNVTCYLDDIYIYLRARSNGAIGRGPPEKHQPKPEAWEKHEDQCMGP